MNWAEYFKENSDKMPKEFLDKEITIEDCLKIIDGMAFTIKELFDKTKWHTGIPTEKGWYLYEYGATGGSYATYYAFTKKRLVYLKEAKRWQKI